MEIYEVTVSVKVRNENAEQAARGVIQYLSNHFDSVKIIGASGVTCEDKMEWIHANQQV